MTETSAIAETADVDVVAEPGGLAAMLGSGDHKVLGRVWIACSLVFGVLAFALAAITAYGQVPGASFPPIDSAFRISTLSRVSMVLLFVIPLFIGLATYVVPLQVGARTVAFPRASAAALWTWLVSGLVMLATFLAGGGFRATDAKLVDLSLLSLGTTAGALLLATVCVVTTVVGLRTPGMTLDRVPFFSWSMLVAGGIWVMQFGVALANLGLVYVDHHFAGGTTPFGRPEAQFGQISWLLSQPAVFCLAIPALGIISDVVVGLSRARQPQRGMVLVGIGLFGALSFGAWAQPAFIKDLPENTFYVMTSVAIGLPLFLVAGGWIAALVKGKPRVAGPLGLALVSGLLLLLGALTSAVYVMRPLDLFTEPQSTNVAELTSRLWGQNAWQIGLSGLVVAACALAAFAGIGYWGAKITGRKVSDGPAKLAVLLGAGGGVLFALPYFGIAFGNASTSLQSGSTLQTFSYVSVAGAALLVAAVLLMGFALLASLGGAQAEDDPWGTGVTLEWATSSPPVRGNFGELALVTSAEPLLDAGEGA